MGELHQLPRVPYAQGLARARRSHRCVRVCLAVVNPQHQQTFAGNGKRLLVRCNESVVLFNDK